MYRDFGVNPVNLTKPWRKQKTASLPPSEDISMIGATFRGPRRGAGGRSSHYRR